ncbi:hypothetical protein PR048_026157 [Dryococelus australis]|uniref:Integrase p58-like C-terminal domain-containing protein n=1 Tax=Dryococelus australis TaxID=614101 RepID=A0ABQ9GKJ5_9NEOP|nr:hypothetical protein PR048_026157 [Dryococelus australis]
MLFGREFRLRGDLLFRRPVEEEAATPDYTIKLRQKLTNIHEFAWGHFKTNNDIMKTRYNRRKPEETFQEGHLVWLCNPQRKKGYCPKLHKSWEGPYTILKQINDVVYRICRQGFRAKPKVDHIDRLVLYEGPDCRIYSGRTDLRRGSVMRCCPALWQWTHLLCLACACAARCLAGVTAPLPCWMFRRRPVVFDGGCLAECARAKCIVDDDRRLRDDGGLGVRGMNRREGMKPTSGAYCARGRLEDSRILRLADMDCSEVGLNGSEVHHCLIPKEVHHCLILKEVRHRKQSQLRSPGQRSCTPLQWLDTGVNYRKDVGVPIADMRLQSAGTQGVPGSALIGRIPDSAANCLILLQHLSPASPALFRTFFVFQMPAKLEEEHCTLARAGDEHLYAKTRLGKVKETASIPERRMEGARVCETELVVSSSHQPRQERRAPFFSIAQLLEAFRPVLAGTQRRQVDFLLPPSAIHPPMYFQTDAADDVTADSAARRAQHRRVGARQHCPGFQERHVVTLERGVSASLRHHPLRGRTAGTASRMKGSSSSSVASRFSPSTLAVLRHHFLSTAGNSRIIWFSLVTRRVSSAPSPLRTGLVDAVQFPIALRVPLGL